MGEDRWKMAAWSGLLGFYRGTLLSSTARCMRPAISRSFANASKPAAARKQIETADFRELGVGGQHKVLAELRRRVLRSRSLPLAAFSALGMRHVKGVLLHGPPGTGKTLLARKLAKLLDAKPPKLVNGPEIFRSWVGESENEIRELFKPARDDHRRMGARAPLHIVIFDEIDAICQARSGGEKSNSAVYDSVVSQVLTMLDGLHDCNNVLVVGITNRPELLDPALLRPGRLEVHLEVGLPTTAERLEVLQLKCAQLEEKGWLDVDLEAVAAATPYFSGAEIESVVLNATSIALDETDDPEAAMEAGWSVTDEHFSTAVAACVPANARDEVDWKVGACKHWLAANSSIEGAIMEIRQQLQQPGHTEQCASWLFGSSARGCGTSAAIKEAVGTAEGIQVMEPVRAASMSEHELGKWLLRALQSKDGDSNSIVVLDSLESILRLDSTTGSCSVANLELLKELLWRTQRGASPLVLASTSQLPALQKLAVPSCFERQVSVPPVGFEKARSLFAPQDEALWERVWAGATNGGIGASSDAVADVAPLGHIVKSASRLALTY